MNYFRFKPLLTVGVLGVLSLSACSGSSIGTDSAPADGVKGSTSTASEQAKLQNPPPSDGGTYDSVAKLQSAYMLAGGDCKDGKKSENVPYSSGSIECDYDTMIDLFSDSSTIEKYRAKDIDLEKALGVGSVRHWVQGNNWLVREASDEAAKRIQAKLGGQFVTFTTSGN